MMIEYSKILYSIEKIIILIKNDDSFILNQDVMNTTLSSFEKLREVFIHFPEDIWIKNNKLFKSKLDDLDVNTSDSVNIILQSIKNKKNFSFDDGDKNSEIITYSNITKNKSDTKNENKSESSSIENKSETKNKSDKDEHVIVNIK
jgi:hypothetical protein